MRTQIPIDRVMRFKEFHRARNHLKIQNKEILLRAVFRNHQTFIMKLFCGNSK